MKYKFVASWTSPVILIKSGAFREVHSCRYPDIKSAKHAISSLLSKAEKKGFSDISVRSS